MKYISNRKWNSNEANIFLVLILHCNFLIKLYSIDKVKLNERRKNLVSESLLKTTGVLFFF